MPIKKRRLPSHVPRNSPAESKTPLSGYKIYYGQCLGNLLRGEYALAQMLAEGLLHDAERRGRAQEAAFAQRILGLTHHMQGAFAEAQTLLEQALEQLQMAAANSTSGTTWSSPPKLTSPTPLGSAANLRAHEA